MEELEAEERKKIFDELYTLTMQRVNDVYNIFKNFFGEEFVDLQSTINFNSKIKEEKCFSNYYNKLPSGSTILKLIESHYTSLRHLTISTLDITILRELLKTIKEAELELTVFKSLFTTSDINILVYFPEVRITNEYGKFVDIKDLFAKVNIDLWGRITCTFKLNRSSYTLLQFLNGYMHSHICNIPLSDFTAFQTPCTGNGPINHTIASLIRDYDADIWNLFCLELSKYVTVESLEGGPYHRLESLKYNNYSKVNNRFYAISTLCDCTFVSYPLFNKEYISSFINKLLKSNKLTFNYSNCDFGIGMSYTDFVLAVSDEFISWFNETITNTLNKGENPLINKEDLLYNGILKSAILNNGNLCLQQGTNGDLTHYNTYIGKKVCTFKGKDYCISIDGIKDFENDNTLTILEPKICLWILNVLLKVLNYNYGRSPKEIETDSNKKVIFL